MGRLGLLNRLANAVAAYNPATLFSGGQQGAWYDPSDFSTMFQDVAGTVPVTATGQAVARINDKSGRGNHATQATAPARPILRIDAAGKYYLEFDGFDDFLQTTSDVITAATSMYACFGAKWTGAGSIDIGTYAAIGSATPLHSFSHFGSGVSYLIYSDAFGDKNASVAQQTTINKHVATFGAVIGSTLSLRFNQASITVNQTTPVAARTASSGLRIGAREGTGYFLNGALYSVIFVGTVLSAAEISSTEGYVNSKTGAF